MHIFHKYGRWSDEMEGEYFFPATGVRRIYAIQQKVCATCNKIKIRRLE